jgi:hypothetical protein
MQAAGMQPHGGLGCASDWILASLHTEKRALREFVLNARFLFYFGKELFKIGIKFIIFPGTYMPQ